MYSSIALSNAEFLVYVHNSYASLVGNDTHEALTNVTDLIVLVQELDVLGDCGLSVWIPGWEKQL